MGSDSVVNGSVPAFSKDFGKDFGKKKRTNRLAKLKQCKLDARREQWLSQAKKKGSKEESNGGGGSPPSSLNMVNNDQNVPMENQETRSRGEENDGSSQHDSDLESLVNSSSSSSIMGVNDSRKDRPGSSCGSSISSISSSSGCCSGNFSEEEEEEEEDECLDDWEAVADALTAADKKKEPPAEKEPSHGEPDVIPAIQNKDNGVGNVKPEPNTTAPKDALGGCAWRPDDAFRPQSLPNLSKQYSFPMSAERQCALGSNPWARRNIISAPSSCPICYEDLDLTDSSFLPCSCGFRLCLFCHKRILEADARCPGCRKQYDPMNGDTGINGGAMPLRLSRSCSMNMRS